MQKSDFFCIFLSGRAASFPSQAPLETKKAVTRLIPASTPLHPTLYTAISCLKGVEEDSTLGRIIACHLTKMVLLLYMLPHPHQSIAYYYHARLLSCDENHAYFLTKKSLDSSSPLYLH